MIEYGGFYQAIEKAVELFKQWDKSEPIQIISHLDADGISAGAIITKVLNRENRKYSISILPQLTKDKLQDLSKEKSKYFIFTDFGSGVVSDMKEALKEKEIIILDHHQPDETKADNICHINPHLFGIDGSKEISGAGVVYLFAKYLNKENEDLAHIAILGAIGDIQEERGFMHLNKEILDTAIKNESIRIKTGLRFFGRQTKPLHKILEYSTDPFIPDVSGSESGAIQFLHQIGIEPKEGSKWKKIIDLNKDEKKKLVAGIIMKRFGEANPEDVLGQIYTLPDEKRESPTRDAREFATLLNACGRMDKASFGIGTCLGIKEDKAKAFLALADYKKEIVKAINWYKDNKGMLVKENGFMILNAEDKVPPTIIGTLASIISKSPDIKEDTYVLSLARTEDNMTKVSLRISGLRKNENIDLRDSVKEMITEIGGESGGHKFAAGALIETAKEKKFLEVAKRVLSRN